MTDQEKKDLAQAYRTMMDLAAWKHFEKMISNIELIAVKNEDDVSIEDLNIARIAECRGRRAAIKQIRGELNYILQGLS